MWCICDPFYGVTSYGKTHSALMLFTTKTLNLSHSQCIVTLSRIKRAPKRTLLITVPPQTSLRQRSTTSDDVTMGAPPKFDVAAAYEWHALYDDDDWSDDDVIHA